VDSLANPLVCFRDEDPSAATRQPRSEYLAQKGKGAKGKNDSELSVLGVLGGANHLFFVLFVSFVVNYLSTLIPEEAEKLWIEKKVPLQVGSPGKKNAKRKTTE